MCFNIESWMRVGCFSKAKTNIFDTIVILREPSQKEIHGRLLWIADFVPCIGSVLVCVFRLFELLFNLHPCLRCVNPLVEVELWHRRRLVYSTCEQFH